MTTLGYPKYGRSQQKGRTGELYLNLFISKNFGWVFRPTNQGDDFGIDGFIDVVEDEGVTGLTIAAQVKCGKSYIDKKTKDGIKYVGENKHLNYYLNLKCPILLFVFDDNPDIGYWVEFDVSKTEKVSNGWMQEIPYENKLDLSVKDRWRSLLPVAEDYSERIERLWLTSETLDKSDSGSYVIDKQGVEELDYTPLLQLLKQLTRTKQAAIKNRNKQFITFLGYDDDPREIYEIPEIRRWFKESLNHQIPWFYLLSPAYDGMAVMVFLYSCCKISIRQKDEKNVVVELLDRHDLDYWLTKNFENLNEFTEKNNVEREINKSISELIGGIVNRSLFAM